MSIRYSYMIGVVLICASCGGSDEKRPSLEQTRAAIEVRDAWRDELKPVEITASGAITGADRIGVRLTSDGKMDFLAFVGTPDCFQPEQASLIADTASAVSACWPLSPSDTVSLTAPFSDRIFGYESGRTVGARLSLQMKFQSSMALLRFCIESDNLTDVLESLTLKGEYIATRGKYIPYNGKWIEKSGEGMPVGIDADCLANSSRSHDFYLIPCDAASDIVLSAVVNGKEYFLKTKIPPLSAGSMTQINLKMDRTGQLLPKSSWVDNQYKRDLRKVAVVDTVKIGHYFRKDGLVVAKRDSITVAVVFQTDGRHGKAVAIEDIPGTFCFGDKNLTSGTIFKSIDGQRNEGIINDSSSSEEERLIYKPEIPYSENTAFGHKDGAELTSRLLNKKKGKEDGTMLAEIEKYHCSYIPSLSEMAQIFYLLQPYAHSHLSELIEPFEGEYLTCSESPDHNFYGIEMGKGIVMSNYSKQYAKLKLRLFYLF
ncbi:hypothetical protein [uncultured Duncaniella sp.]|uniref:hypothetical protein n=1 Tax=uncultured Duncaniella sp. TaxID=2768039 RepID=UPI0025B6879B|nr:hypothetical protein [uncultured Duncaniella sp.]